ncbi:MAG: hypothetical protein SF028_12770 [Candidatus Sumerlaeia bacterium]|nr:hypothetical protein [Candidatus Sumerlaeia bacterium]
MNRTPVTFRSHNAYAATYSEPGWAALVMPNDLQAEHVRVERKDTFGKDVYMIFWGQALETQLRARFRNNYEEGTRFLAPEDAEDLSGLIAATREASRRTPADGERWREAATETIAAARMKAGAPEDDRRYNDLAEYLADPPTHFVEVRDPSAEIDAERMTFRFQGVVRDGHTGRELLRKSFNAASETLSPGLNTKATVRDMQSTALQPVTGALYLFAQDIEEARSTW